MRLKHQAARQALIILAANAKGAIPQRRGDLCGALLRYDLAAEQNQRQIGIRRLVEIRRRKYAFRAALIQILAHDRPQLAARERIDADGGLIEHQKPRTSRNRAGDAELLFHPAGERIHGVIFKFQKPHAAQKPAQILLAVF